MAGRLPVDGSVSTQQLELSPQKVNDALNSIASQAYAPFTTFVEATTGVTAIGSGGTTPAKVPGLECNLVVPVPSLVRISWVVDATVATLAAGEVLILELYQDAVALGGYAQSLFIAGANTRVPVYGQWVTSTIFPQKVYAFDLRASLSTGTTARYNLAGSKSRMTLVTEAVQRVA